MLQIAAGSASEAEFQIMLAHKVGYLSDETRDRLTSDIVEMRKILHALIRRCRR
jgi:four helix bundle protein